MNSTLFIILEKNFTLVNVDLLVSTTPIGKYLESKIIAEITILDGIEIFNKILTFPLNNSAPYLSVALVILVVKDG